MNEMCRYSYIISKKFFFVLITFLCISLTNAQNINSINSDTVSSLSDTELNEYIAAARARGLTLEQIKTLALSRGISATVVDQAIARVNGQGVNNAGGVTEINNSLEIQKDPEPVVQIGNIELAEVDDPLFGYNFFNNPNISFTPNLNLTTPSNYELGPGDELVINLWGAAENTYDVAVDRTGAIRIPGIGPVYVSGLTFDRAKSKIEGNLKKIYSGISAPSSNPYKVNLDVSLVNVRTISVNVIGEVKAPGTYSLSALSTILHALYASGGPTKDGTFRKIKLIRNGEEVNFFDIYKYLIDGSQEGNKTLQDQDVIIVSPYISRIRVSGALKRTGIYEILPEESLNDLITYASGFTSKAYKDKIRLERISEDRKVLKEISFKEVRNENLKDGDVITIDDIIDKIINKIEIEGAVYRPGVYQFSEGLTLKEFIKRASGLTEEAFLERGIITRKVDGVTNTAIPFSVSEVVNGNTTVNLQVNDKVQIFNARNFKEEGRLYIDGAVNNGNDFPFVENMSIQDLVVLAGGFSKGANREVIDIFRHVIDDNFETLSESFKVSVGASLNLEDGTPFILEPNDRISVRWLKGFSEQKRVFVDGEANFPGAYSISSKNERISDLIDRAGGLSPYAFVEGGVLIRKNPYYREDSDAINATLENSNLEGNKNRLDNQSEFSVGINLKEILEEGGEDSKSNLVLESGDRIFIPSIQETIKVEGRVLLPSLIKYEDRLSLRDYIDKSGGFADRAKRSKTYVVHPNGDVATTSTFLFFKNYPKIRPGSVVIVPVKPEAKSPVTLQEGLGVVTGLSTIGLLIDRIFR